MLEGQVAIVTGSGRGIGKEIAMGFAREGASVVVADVDESGSKETINELKEEGYTRATFIKTDLSSISDIKNLVKETQDYSGNGIDILINAAGICEQVDLFDIDEENWNKTLDINLKGAFFTAQKVAEVMAKKGAGRIINIASTSSYLPSTRCMVPYDVSKAGIKMMTKCLAELLGPYNINVNAIAPATTKTKMVEQIFGEEYFEGDWVSQKYPLGRIAYPSDHLKAALFLCSKDAGYINGTVLLVDGGFLMAYRR